MRLEGAVLACAAGLDPAAGRLDPTGASYSTSNWPSYVQELYDPTVDDIQEHTEPEICKILGEKTDTSVNMPGRELKDPASQRFAVRGHAPQPARSRSGSDAPPEGFQPPPQGTAARTTRGTRLIMPAAATVAGCECGRASSRGN